MTSCVMEVIFTIRACGEVGVALFCFMNCTSWQNSHNTGLKALMLLLEVRLQYCLLT